MVGKWCPSPSLAGVGGLISQLAMVVEIGQLVFFAWSTAVHGVSHDTTLQHLTNGADTHREGARFFAIVSLYIPPIWPHYYELKICSVA